MSPEAERLNREGEAAARAFIAEYHRADSEVEALLMVIPHRGGVNDYWALIHDKRKWPHRNEYTSWSNTWDQYHFGEDMAELVDYLCRYYQWEVKSIMTQYNDYLLKRLTPKP